MTRSKQIFAGLAIGAVILAGTRALLRSAARRESVDLNAEDVPGSFVDVNGRLIHYVEAGTGEPMVLLHGWSGSTFSMRYAIPELANYFRVIAIDLLGYGFSGRPEDGDYSDAGQAALVLATMDKLGIARATLLGHSMGGGIAMTTANIAPQRIDRLVLVDTVTSDEARRARFAVVMRPLLPLAGLLVSEGGVRRSLRRMAHDPAFVTQDVVDGYLRPLRVKGHLRAQSKQFADRRTDSALDPAGIQQETLLLWGEHDHVIPLSTGLRLAEEIPHAELAIVRGAGHLPLEEQPEESNKLLLQFLDRSPRGAEPSTNGVARESAPSVS